jgi:hypothetical protein
MPIVLKSGSLNFFEASGLVQACSGIVVYLYIPITIETQRDVTPERMGTAF